MKYLYQMLIIGAVTFAGEVLKLLLPFSIPASIYGLVLMLLCLLLGIIKEEQIKETAGWLVAVMPVMFISPAVGIMKSYRDMKDSIVPFVVVIFVTTFVVMAVTGCVAQGIIHMQKRRKEKKNG